MGVTQERVAAPLICTVHAPQSAIPQPNLVPVMPSTSRSTHKSGVSPSTSTTCVVPLTLMVKAMARLPSGKVGIVLKCTCRLDLTPSNLRLKGHIYHLLGQEAGYASCRVCGVRQFWSDGARGAQHFRTR